MLKQLQCNWTKRNQDKRRNELKKTERNTGSRFKWISNLDSIPEHLLAAVSMDPIWLAFCRGIPWHRNVVSTLLLGNWKWRWLDEGILVQKGQPGYLPNQEGQNTADKKHQKVSVTEQAHTNVEGHQDSGHNPEIHCTGHQLWAPLLTIKQSYHGHDESHFGIWKKETHFHH